MFVPYMEVFSIDSWGLNKPNKQIKLLGAAVSLPGKVVPLEHFSQTSCIFMRGKSSTWVISSDNLSPYQVNLFHLKSFHRQAVSSLWLFFFETVSFQDGRQWLTALAVFLFLISLAFYGWFFLFLEFCSNEKKILVKLDTNFSPFFHLRCYSQVDSIVTFISDYSVTLLLSKFLRSIETTKLRVRIVTRINLAGHKNRCSVGLPNGSKCLNIFTKSQRDLNYHIAIHHSTPKPVVMFKFEFRYQKMQEFYSLSQHEDIKHGFLIDTTNIDQDDIIN